jgi:hypothetical protein
MPAAHIYGDVYGGLFHQRWLHLEQLAIHYTYILFRVTYSYKCVIVILKIHFATHYSPTSNFQLNTRESIKSRQNIESMAYSHSRGSCWDRFISRYPNPMTNSSVEFKLNACRALAGHDWSRLTPNPWSAAVVSKSIVSRSTILSRILARKNRDTNADVKLARSAVSPKRKDVMSCLLK